MIAKTERFELRLDSEILERIDDWRGEQPDLPSRSAAVRRLIETGLGQPEDDQLFQIARFNILVAAKTPGPDRALANAYVFAWDRGVYPLFHEGAHLHQPFSSQFRVLKEMVNELAKYLDDRWLAKEVPSFYELEDYYDIRSGRTAWDRGNLIAGCRYMFLNDMFDSKFWSTLLAGSDHPTEAKSIRRKFNVDDDIYLN
jgi:hypothetical protein